MENLTRWAIGKRWKKEEKAINRLYELSQHILELASDLEKQKIKVDDVPKCFMNIIDDENNQERNRRYND
jgi:PhoPQ-activated pathogenicity-related protein